MDGPVWASMKDAQRMALGTLRRINNDLKDIYHDLIKIGNDPSAKWEQRKVALAQKRYRAFEATTKKLTQQLKKGITPQLAKEIDALNESVERWRQTYQVQL